MQKLHREYPHLRFAKQWELTDNLLLLLGQCEAYVNAIINTPIMPTHYQKLMSVALVKGAQATTAIEGNTLTEEEINGLLKGQKLSPSREYLGIEVQNIYDALNSLLDSIVDGNQDSLITTELLKNFHKMVGKNLGDSFNAIPGQLRNADVIVGSYRCPDHRDVPFLLEQFCEFVKEYFKYGRKKQSFSEVIVQAIVLHIYIEWIHPFNDGNGRTGRLVEFYILLRGGSPDISSHLLSNFYNQTRSEYYRQIEKATATKNLTEFLEYAVLGFRDGLFETIKTIQGSQFEITWRHLIYEKLEEIKDTFRDTKVFKRQRMLALELPLDKPFKIGDIPTLSVNLAVAYSKTSEKTISRDLNKLIDLELVNKAGNDYKTNTDSIKQLMARRKKIQHIPT